MNTVTDIDNLMTKREVAEYIAKHFKQSVVHIYERTMYLPDFPAHVVLPTTGSVHPRLYRWKLADINQWIESKLRQAA